LNTIIIIKITLDMNIRATSPVMSREGEERGREGGGESESSELLELPPPSP